MRMPVRNSNIIIFWSCTSYSVAKWNKNQRSKQKKISNYSKDGDLGNKFGVSSSQGTENDEELH